MGARRSSSSEVEAVAAEVESRLASGPWEIPPRDEPPPTVVAAAEVATFALKLSGRRRQARSGSRLRRLITHFALAACLALASVAAACEKPDATEAEQAETLRTLPSVSSTDAVITQPARGSPARFEELVLVTADSEQQPWAVMLPKSGGEAPILVDVGAGLTRAGSVYRIAANPIAVGTRDGPTQFLDPQAPATETDSDAELPANASQVVERWREDERYLAATRAMRGQLTVLDAAYNAENAVAAGGTHSYADGVVLRVDPDNPVLAVTDKALLESGRPTREEDVVYVAIRPGERSLYEAGQVVNLKDVVMNREQTDVDGQPRTMYIANAALEGARVEPAGRVDLQQLLGQRLDRVDRDLAAQVQEAGAPQPAAAATPQATSTSGAPVQQPTVIRQGGHASYVDDFLIFMLLANSGFFRGPGMIVNNPGPSPNRSGDIYYSSSPRPSGSGPSTVASSQTDSRNTAMQAARTSVSGQASGTGGGVAATNKAAADASARASAATTKAATVAGGVSAASAGKSITSVPRTSSSTASRGAGTVSAGARGSTSSSSGSSSSSGGKGIGGASSGGFGGSGATSGGSS